MARPIATERAGVNARQAPNTSRTPHDGLMTVRDVARLLHMSERWVHERTRRREIPCYRFGTALRFDQDETRAWMARWHEAPERS